MPSHRTSPSPHLPPLTAPPGFTTPPARLQTPVLFVTPWQSAVRHLQRLSGGRDAADSPGSVLVVPGLRSSPPLAGKEDRGWRKSGRAYLLRIRVPVIPQARVGQHEPMFLPLRVDWAGGGKGKDRRETDKQLPGEA